MAAVMDKSFAKNRLAEVIESKIGVAETSQRIMEQIPDDSIVHGSGINFTSNGNLMMHAGGGIKRATPQQNWNLHTNSFVGLGQRAEIPSAFMNRLASGEPWQREMLCEVLDRSFTNIGGRYLVRAVKGEARAFLSDKYRRLDSRPIFDAFVGAANKIGAVPISGVATDLRVAVKALVPRIYDIGGDPVAFGIEWRNSDFGAGAHQMSIYILRLICLNGATGEDVVRSIHLGRALEDNLKFSQKTLQLDTQTVVSATSDIVDSTLGEPNLNRIAGMLTERATEEVHGTTVVNRLSKLLTKEELRQTIELFNGHDVINLPPMKTMWRASNAVSWMAKSVKDSERKLDLERVAGAMIN